MGMRSKAGCVRVDYTGDRLCHRTDEGLDIHVEGTGCCNANADDSSKNKGEKDEREQHG